MRMMMLSVMALVFVAGSAATALAAPSGTAEGVRPEAEAILANDARTLTVGADIFLGDKLMTGPKGQVQIRFVDDTELVVGPHSSLVIEDYLIRNDGSAGKLAVTMLGGSFRFVTGHAAKDRYLITTPTGTIGVRGTGFDVFVGLMPRITPTTPVLPITRILMYHGKTIFCTLKGDCKILEGLCAMGEIDANETAILGDPREFNNEEFDVVKGQFIYSDNQQPLFGAYRITNAFACTHRTPEVGGPESISSGDLPEPGKQR